MKSIRLMPLIVAITIISGLIIFVTQLRLDGFVSLRTGQIAGYSAFGLNAIVAILGLWTRHRVAWAGYLVISAAAMLLISASTPLSGLLIMTMSLFHSLSHG